jgi:preprotein translocase subunit SecY
MPVIFAACLMVIPALLAQAIFGGGSYAHSIFSRSGFVYSVIYIALVFFFTYFWTGLFFRPEEMSEQLKEFGSFVPGIRPGERTAQYLRYIMDRVCFVGAAFLALIALMPDITAGVLKIEPYVAGFLGGTGILIVVGVGLDVVQKVESHLIMRRYDGFLSGGRRVRGRR